MNTPQLKKFAQETRLRLIQIVTDKLNYVLTGNSAELLDYEGSIKKLKEDINRMGKEAMIDKVAYTWFNRLMALRFMDANDYQPLRVKVLSAQEGFTQPEILDQALQGVFPKGISEETQQKINDLLDGKIPSANPQNEVYRLLLIASCNYLHGLFPFLFEKLKDYSELLLPDDLISELSIIQDFVNGMTAEDCQEVEIMGWLYQFYISELNDELISSKKAYKKNELAPASQLFTPKWIVQYMVDNTLGQVWAELNPNTKILDDLEFYITPDYKGEVTRQAKSIKEIKFLEPCVGSGHILAYAFDVFYKMYEEAGYSLSEIPFLIIKNNLYGVDIDIRAAQIASFTVLMKGREKYYRFFRKLEKEKLVPNVYHYEDFKEDKKFNNATALGSLIRVSQEEADKIQVKKDSLFAESQQKLKNLYDLLSRKYDVVVTNPPYISSSRMESSLKKYVSIIYPETRSDLFATFILRCLEMTNKEGLTGNMTPFVWMFISSYQKLREILIDNHFINNLIQLEYSGFDGATVPICTFTLRNQGMDAKGSYIRLSDFRGSQNQAPKTLEAIRNPNCGWFYVKNQKDFKKIPGYNIGYWLSDSALKSFDLFDKLNEVFEARKGLVTSDNNRFLRYWFEIEKETSSLNLNVDKEKKWYKYNKGGSFRRWYGNLEYVINWNQNGYEIKNFFNPDGSLKSRPQNLKYNFKETLTWSKITSGSFSSRLYESGGLNDDAAAICYKKNSESYFETLGLLNTKVTQYLLKALNPTLNIQIGDIGKLPITQNNNLVKKTFFKEKVEKNIKISQQEWNSRETSWDFKQNELIRLNGQDIEEAIDLYKIYWSKKFFELHQNEEELNKEFIHIYGLEEDLSPDVPLTDITLLKDELKQKKLKALSENYQSGWELVNGEWCIVNGEMVDGEWSTVNGENEKPTTKNKPPTLPFDTKELIKQFISYAVGCMMGRYSLEKEGLILANQGETLSDYRRIVDGEDEKPTTNHQPLTTKNQPPTTNRYTPDEDAIIPVLDTEWFEDDIVTQFKDIVRAVWGKGEFVRNIAFIEKTLGKSIRDYFYKDFYDDHVKRYKKRPIYWLFSSPKGSFQALIYMHRYTPNTINWLINNYLRPYIDKLENHIEHLGHVMDNGSPRERNRAEKDIAKTEKMIAELRKYDREVMYPLALEQVEIDLDDGVLVNYNKFGQTLKTVSGLNDPKKKKAVKKFDWIDTSEIRD